MLAQLLEWLSRLKSKAKKLLGPRRNRWLLAGIVFVFFYIAGILAQFFNNRYQWSPGKELYLPSVNPLKGFAMLFTPFGAQAIVGLFLFSTIVVLLVYMNREDRTGMIYDKARNFWYSKKGVYGTAGWMTDEEMRKAFDVTPVAEIETVKEVIYGIKDEEIISRQTDSFLNRHVAVMGSSGSMKSRTITRATIISCVQQGHSMVITDCKGELSADCLEYCKDHGYVTKILNTCDPYNSDAFDGLEGARERPIFVANIVEACIKNTGGGIGDPIYDHAEGALLTALIFLQLERDDVALPSIKGAYQVLLDTANTEELDMYFAGCEKPSRALQAYNLFRKASPNMQGNICLGLGTRLSILQNEEIADLMCGSDMDLVQLGKQKTAYFLVLSDQDASTQFISATFFSLLFLRLVEFADQECPDKRLPVPVTLILDEFCSIVGSINGFPQKLSNIRSRNIHATIIFQQLGQLMNRFPDNLWSEILGNVDVIACLGCSSDPVTAKFISDRSGEVTIYADTIMKSKNIFTPSMLQPNFRHSEGAGRRKLLTYDEVMRLDRSQMLIMVNGQQMLQVEKFDYTRHPESKKFRPIQVRGLERVVQPPSLSDDAAMKELQEYEKKNGIPEDAQAQSQETGRSYTEPAAPPVQNQGMGGAVNKKRKGVRKNVDKQVEHQLRFEGVSQTPDPEHDVSGTGYAAPPPAIEMKPSAGAAPPGSNTAPSDVSTPEGVQNIDQPEL